MVMAYIPDGTAHFIHSRVLALFRGAASQHRAHKLLVEKVVARRVVGLHPVDAL